MRIALIVPGFSASEDDWCIPAILDLVRVLSCDHEVVVFAIRYPHFRAEYTVYGADVQAFGGADARGLSRIALLRRVLTAVMTSHVERPFDVIHGLWADEPGFIATTAGKRLRVPSVVSIMGGELLCCRDIAYGGQLGRINSWLIRRSFNRATVVTVGSTYLGQLASSVLAARVRVAESPLGVDSRLFERAGLSCPSATFLSGEPALLSVGSLIPIKDHGTLFLAISVCVETFPNLHLHVVGDGPMRASLGRAACRLGISQHVTFHGEVNHERMPDFYRAADLALVASRHESQSLVAIEAAACGCPLLGTAVGVVPDLSSPSRDIPVAGVEALAQSMSHILTHPAARERLIEEGSRIVRERYTLDRTVPALLELYRSVSR